MEFHFAALEAAEDMQVAGCNSYIYGLLSRIDAKYDKNMYVVLSHFCIMTIIALLM